jgi:hypothetical protein
MSAAPATKVVYLARRNPSLSLEAFPERWRQHSLLAGSMPSIRPGFAQVAQCINLYDREIVARATLDYDGVNLLTLTDPAYATIPWQSDEVLELILPDELATFDGYVRHFSLTTLEHVVVDGPMQPFCLILFLKRDRHLGLDPFASAIIDVHRQMAAGTPRAVVNIVTDRQPGYNFDAVTELWFAHAEQARDFTSSPAYRETYVPRRDTICEEWRTLTFMSRINYARPPLQTA